VYVCGWLLFKAPRKVKPLPPVGCGGVLWLCKRLVRRLSDHSTLLGGPPTWRLDATVDSVRPTASVYKWQTSQKSPPLLAARLMVVAPDAGPVSDGHPTGLQVGVSNYKLPQVQCGNLL